MGMVCLKNNELLIFGGEVKEKIVDSDAVVVLLKSSD